MYCYIVDRKLNVLLNTENGKFDCSKPISNIILASTNNKKLFYSIINFVFFFHFCFWFCLCRHWSETLIKNVCEVSSLEKTIISITLPYAWAFEFQKPICNNSNFHSTHHKNNWPFSILISAFYFSSLNFLFIESHGFYAFPLTVFLFFAESVI